MKILIVGPDNLHGIMTDIAKFYRRILTQNQEDKDGCVTAEVISKYFGLTKQERVQKRTTDIYKADVVVAVSTPYGFYDEQTTYEIEFAKYLGKRVLYFNLETDSDLLRTYTLDKLCELVHGEWAKNMLNKKFGIKEDN